MHMTHAPTPLDSGLHNVVLDIDEFAEVIDCGGNCDHSIRPCCIGWSEVHHKEIITSIPGTPYPCPDCRSVWVFCGHHGGKSAVIDIVDAAMLNDIEKDH